MSNVGFILVLSALLASLLALGATALHGIVTGRQYYEPSCPPIVFRERPMKFCALLMIYVVLVSFLIVGCVQVGRLLFYQA